MDNPDVGDDTKGGDVITYNGGEFIPFIPSREELVNEKSSRAENAFIQDKIENNKKLSFMPHDISDGVHFRDKINYYSVDISCSLPNGLKALVKVINFKPFIDIWVPNGMDPEKFRETIAGKMSSVKNQNYHSSEILTAKTCKRFAPEKPVCRVHYLNANGRKDIIVDLIKSGYETASDESAYNSYFRTFAKTIDLRLCEWMWIKNYTRNLVRNSLFSHVFVVNYLDIKNLSQEDIDKAVAANPLNKMFYTERSLVMTWDTETRTNRPGQVPDPECEDDDIFMLCCTFHWKDSDEPLLQICLVDVPTAGDTRWITVVCGDSRNIILAFKLIVSRLFPDYLAGFNDFGYDWPFILAKIDQYGLEPVFPERGDYNFRCSYVIKMAIKLSADENAFASFIHVFGIIPIDVQIYYKKLYPKSEASRAQSLKHYLKISNLPTKADMPINIMNKYYRAACESSNESTEENMRHVSYYCVVDALRCQQLLIKRNVISEVRDICNLANEYIYNGFMRAGGSRVNNLLGREFNKLNYLTSSVVNKVDMTEKYQGAYVFPPERGISPNPLVVMEIENGDIKLEDIAEKMKGSRPIVGLDFASLYPSIICTYNLSPEMMIDDDDEAHELIKAGVELNEISFDYAGSVIRSWSVKHKNDPKMIGVYPTVLTNLKNHRKKIKKILGEQEAIKEAYSLASAISKSENVTLLDALKLTVERQPSTSFGVKCLTSDTAEDVIEKYNKACFAYVTANAKQSAVKVYMNTFYGEAGNSKSPFFKLALAGGVTAYGRKTIKMVADYVRERGFRIKYGDTDSLYLEAPGHVFSKCDEEFINGGTRHKWYSDQVEITMFELKKLQVDVNQFLIRDNGSTYLEMNFEEVMYPVVFCGKKKYYGIAHVGAVNFTPHDLFIRGIEIIKQGQSDISKKVGKRIMNESMLIDNNKTMLDIVKNTIYDLIVNDKQWEFSDFILSSAYKPHKNNISNNKFMKRMQTILDNLDIDDPQRAKYKLPEPGDRFNYVVVKRNVEYSLRGNLIALSKSDRMEFVSAAEGKDPDLEYYVEQLILGLCARFISGDPMFNTVAGAATDDDRADYDDKKTHEDAKKFLLRYIKSITHGDRSIDRARGAAYRAAFKIANAEYLNMIKQQYGSSKAFTTQIMRYLIELNDLYEINQSNFTSSLKEIAASYIPPLDEYIDVPVMMNKIFSGFKRNKIAMHYDIHLSSGKHLQNAILTNIENDIEKLFPSMIKLIFVYRQNLQTILDQCRTIVENSRNAESDIDHAGILDVIKTCTLKEMPENTDMIAFEINLLWERLLMYSRLCQVTEAITARFRDELEYKAYGNVYSKKEVSKIVGDASERLALSSSIDNFL